jgi:hypothetical protein
LPGTNVPQPGDEYGDEALAFTKELCMQREVTIEPLSVNADLTTFAVDANELVSRTCKLNVGSRFR